MASSKSAGAGGAGPSFKGGLPADLFDPTTLVSLASTVAILGAAYGASLVALDRRTASPSRRFLFVWHAFDALIHFCLEGGFLYHCFFSWLPLSAVPNPLALAPTAHNYLGRPGRAYGPQAGGNGALARLWMVYAKADRRWAGADLVRAFFPLLPIFFPSPPLFEVVDHLAPFPLAPYRIPDLETPR